jgi:hypothetical protein
MFCAFFAPALQASGAVYTNEICQPSDSKNVCCKRETPHRRNLVQLFKNEKIVFLLLSPDGGG